MIYRQSQQSFNLIRPLAITVLLFLFFCIISILVRDFLKDILGIIVSFVIGLMITPIIASPIEWFGHKYICHRNFRWFRRIYSVHSLHHLQFSAGRNIAHDLMQRIPIIRRKEPVVKNIKIQNTLTYLAQMLFYTILGVVFICLPAGIFSGNLFYFCGTVTGVLVISNLFIFVHDTVHRPGKHRIVENQKWFRFLNEHHYLHHIDPKVNFNFLLPLGDFLFGTLKKKLTIEEIFRYGERKPLRLQTEIDSSNKTEKCKASLVSFK